MTARTKFYQPGSIERRMLGPLAWRPRLTTGIAAGLALFAGLSLFDPAFPASARAVVSWDLTASWFTVLVLIEMHGQAGVDIAARVAAQDEARGLILVVVVMAAAASLVAVGVELSSAKGAQGWLKAFRVGAVIGTVALSWAVVQIVFALHYAHEFYAPDRSTATQGDVAGGLQFPGDPSPDYWDFLYFSVIIGVASQTADVSFTSKTLRRIGTVHGLVAFTFNTIVLALTINLVAGLF